MEPLGYRFFKGRQGAAGYVRRMDGGCAVCCRGLRPGESYVLRALPLGDAMGERQADGDGCVTFQGAYPTGLFLSQGDQVTLWDGGDEGFLQARESLRRLFRRPAEREDKKPPEPRENTIPPDEQREPAPEEAAEKEPAPAYTLRPEGDGAPVDGLPPLSWPDGTEHVQKYFQFSPPIRLFDELMWRFVRVPSPIRQAAYCAVGMHVSGDDVDALAYAVPGGPYTPPAPLPGYRYRMGKEGMGYWVAYKRGNEK